MITSVADDVKKREHLYSVGRKVDWYSHMENTMEISQRLKNRTTTQFSNHILGMESKDTRSLSQRNTYYLMVIAALFTTAKTYRQTKCPWTDEWI